MNLHEKYIKLKEDYAILTVKYINLQKDFDSCQYGPLLKDYEYLKYAFSVIKSELISSQLKEIQEKIDRTYYER